MSEFLSFLQLGFHHIADPKAFDHLLFVVTLCAVYRWTDWRKLLVLITAFTIGHSLTLLLAGFHILNVPKDLVEFLIPVTIVLTSVHNIWAKKGFLSLTQEGLESPAPSGTFSRSVSTNYLLALFFGLIHGMGFANYFTALMGEAGNIVEPLFAFNVGIEVGQMMIVGVFFGFYFLLAQWLKIQHRDWNLYVSGLGAGGALVLILQNILS
ncbi:MAG: HupE/UreJ family protein [Saprospiraceae bacterium]|nr:HupE/UreJ family protein [Saprospiraceae bacterium]MCF8250010.1 HupE/UreJ family protein [Saprospiraceae bacterium]MCF8278950.1 HupE/UreJ family protein [Bacteroidales bacterium]MCF8311023.1 HupE/UreJ family protein [Saprospiraceae bacterium]MCF8439641.1 HupE/UreJ family protein [Saprospiraceae bacterium]